MTELRLRKFIERPVHIKHTGHAKSILIGNSIGKYLRDHVDVIPECASNIDFVCIGGATFSYFHEWLVKNLDKKVQQFGNINLLILLGTCDLTQKNGRFIKLRHNDDDTAINYLKNYIDKFISIISDFQTVKPVFFEIPPYSILEWNKYQGHLDCDIYREQDFILNNRISAINEYIIEVNNKATVSSPRFKLDLIKYRKSKEKDNHRKALNFKLYKDGIHPIPVLARCWMKRILLKVSIT